MDTLEHIESHVYSGVSAEESAKVFKYCLGDELEDIFLKVAGKLVLNRPDLDNIGISGRNIKLLRFMDLVLHHSRSVKF